MAMVHYDVVLENTIEIVSKELEDAKDDEVYIVQNVYGKILVYVKTQKKDLVEHLTNSLKDTIGEWLSSCEKYGDNFFVVSEIDSWKKNIEPVSKNIWVFEKYLTNSYWDGQNRKGSNSENKSKRVSFFSFKGGVGRTTAVIMSAMELARQGKKLL